MYLTYRNEQCEKRKGEGWYTYYYGSEYKSSDFKSDTDFINFVSREPRTLRLGHDNLKVMLHETIRNDDF